MATNSWKIANDGFWNTDTDWTLGVAPIAGDDAFVTVTGGSAYTINLISPTAALDSLTISSATATLFIDSGFLNLTFSGGTDTLSLNAGAVRLANFGGINAPNGISIGASAILEGNGTVTGNLTGSGNVLATGGDLTLNSAIGVGLHFTIANVPSSVLEIDGKISPTNTFTFQSFNGSTQEFIYNNTGKLISENIVGLAVGSSAAPSTNFIDFRASALTVAAVNGVTGSNEGSGTGGTVRLSDNSTLTLSGITNGAGNWFVNTVSDSAGGTDVFLSTVCYVAGTRILTAEGERAIENLLQGDIVLTLSDGELKEQPVKWVGHRRIDLAAHPRPETVAPVRVQRGAFADDMPHTDLLLSPDHAIFVDGKLISARQLVNGTTIVQERDWTMVDYYHVELDQHAILLAEGLPAESYIDTGNSGFFANSEAPLVLHPDLTDETDYPTREAASCAPFVWDEASVQPVWQRLADRAAAIGRPVPQRVTTTDAGVRLILGRRTIKPIFSNSDLIIFAMPRGIREVGLVSRGQSPTEARPWLEDRRQLGVRVKRIVLRGADDVREVPMDHPDLTQGWWAVEHDGQVISRWTDGEARLPLPAMSGNVILEIHLAGSMLYAEDAMPAGGTERRAVA